jgi:hypothetical protein
MGRGCGGEEERSRVPLKKKSSGPTRRVRPDPDIKKRKNTLADRCIWADSETEFELE